jgi:hypothetical protein
VCVLVFVNGIFVLFLTVFSAEARCSEQGIVFTNYCSFRLRDCNCLQEFIDLNDEICMVFRTLVAALHDYITGFFKHL